VERAKNIPRLSPPGPGLYIPSEEALPMTEQLQSPPWAIVRILTDKGIRLGLEYPEEVADEEKAAILAYPVADDESQDRIAALSKETGIPEYDGEEEEFLRYAPETSIR
jgi:hypothetical protein